jgi:predicted adenine nucleotide alpha hydrolase (AANH) superfamily ATPase
MLVHICCSVDSHYYLKRLRELLPDEPLVGYFYNPNIHPRAEYELRLADVARSCEMYGIELLEGEYDDEAWFARVAGLECEPERGDRCEVCFRQRLEATARKALEIGERVITTTLLMSPKKSFAQLGAASDAVAREYGVEAKCYDFRKNGGSQEQFALARSDKLYHQNYCGCIYALTRQREAQKRPLDELMSPLSGAVLPSSIADKSALYARARECEKMGRAYEIAKERFVNYRLLGARAFCDGEIVGAYLISEFDEGFDAKVLRSDEITAQLSNGATVATLTHFNQVMNTDYKSIKDMVFDPPALELKQRAASLIAPAHPLIIMQYLPKNRLKLDINAAHYSDIREVLVIL